jgi:hypothetical protein
MSTNLPDYRVLVVTIQRVYYATIILHLKLVLS